jgi:hypothetical protein
MDLNDDNYDTGVLRGDVEMDIGASGEEPLRPGLSSEEVTGIYELYISQQGCVY